MTVLYSFLGTIFGINEFVVELSLLTMIKFLTVNRDSREVPELEVITHFEYGKYWLKQFLLTSLQ